MSTREDQFVSETRPARLIAVGNLISLQAAATEQSFATELERIVGMAVPHLATDRPNLIVLGEILGLPLALSGKRGYLSRLMQKDGWKWLTIPPGQSQQVKKQGGKYLGPTPGPKP